jgi:aspartate/methionine/tyrosine aminotransferase
MIHPTLPLRTARRTHGFTESVIREMTRVATEHGSINLAQGFPDFPAPELLKEAACAAIRADVNQYAVTWGTPRLRKALAAKYQRFYGLDVDETREVVITCGATEALAAALLAVINPGEEVIIFEPFYENYGPDAVLCGARPVWVPLEASSEIDFDRLEAVISERTRAIVVNSPNNPTGRVFTRAELERIAELCERHDLVAFTDEIYEHIFYEGEHIPLSTIGNMRERTVTVSGFSKTFSVTGWRVGTIVAPADLTVAIRKVHDFLTVGAPHPLQEACATALEQLSDEYYHGLAAQYRARRDLMCKALVEAGYSCAPPAGAYYVMADFSGLSDLDDRAFALWLARGDGASDGAGGVATVPGSSFFHDPGLGKHLVRFAFCKKAETLEAAAARLRAISYRPK